MWEFIRHLYLFPAQWIWFFCNYNRGDFLWWIHSPPTERGFGFVTRVNTNNLFCGGVIMSIVHIVNKGLLTRVFSNRSCVECICSVISSSVPIEKGSWWHLQFSRGQHPPQDLNYVAPWNRYWPKTVTSTLVLLLLLGMLCVMLIPLACLCSMMYMETY